MTSSAPETDHRPVGARMPALFVAHGAPVLLDDAAWMDELASWAQALPKPSGILMVSAHWEERPTTLGATRTVPLVYDFYGFPERYYETRYPAPGAPDLATRVHQLLHGSGIQSVEARSEGSTMAHCLSCRCIPRPTCPCSRFRCPASSQGAVRPRPGARTAAR